jgi:hypothetical protein
MPVGRGAKRYAGKRAMVSTRRDLRRGHRGVTITSMVCLCGVVPDAEPEFAVPLGERLWSMTH